MRSYFFLLHMALLVLSACGNKDNAAINEILAVRATSNQAIARHDTTTMSRTWTKDFHMITSRNSEVSGRPAALRRLVSEFQAKPDVIYVRSPKHIEVFDSWNMASEEGEWAGTWNEQGVIIKLSGNYFAKWHRVDGSWLIRAEVFVPMSCSGGAFCDRSPI